MDKTATFQRNQCEWALWHVQRRLGAVEKPPKRFQTRVKRLLEIDRAGHQEDMDPAFSYTGGGPSGKGSDAAFTAFDAFCLGLALDLQNLGLNQSEAVFVVRHTRASLLESTFTKILAGPSRHGRAPLNPAHHQELPTVTKDDHNEIDLSVFLVIRKFEIREVLPKTTQAKLDKNQPVVLEPDVCWGSAELGRQLSTLRLSTRSALVVELGFLASALPGLLARAPVRRRGQS